MRNKSKNLFERLMIDDLDLIYYTFPFLKDKYKLVLQKAYGSDLTGDFDSSSLTDEESKNILFHAIRSFKNIIKHTKMIVVTIDNNSDNNYYFYQFFRDYDPRDVFKIVHELAEKEKELLQLVYGDYLTDSFKDIDMSDSMIKEFVETISNIQNRLISFPKVSINYSKTYVVGYEYVPSLNGTKRMSLLEYYSNYSFQEISSAVDRLKEEDRILVIKVYGDRFDEVRPIISKITCKERAHLDWIVKIVLKRYLEELAKVNRLLLVFEENKILQK